MCMYVLVRIANRCVRTVPITEQRQRDGKNHTECYERQAKFYVEAGAKRGKLWQYL